MAILTVNVVHTIQLSPKLDTQVDKLLELLEPIDTSGLEQATRDLDVSNEATRQATERNQPST
jgi:hypothetical protein